MPFFCLPALLEAKANTTNSTSQTLNIEVLRGSDITLWCINSCDQKYSWLRDGDTLSQLNENRGVLYITNVTTPSVFNCTSGISRYQKDFLVSVIGKWPKKENPFAYYLNSGCGEHSGIASAGLSTKIADFMRACLR